MSRHASARHRQRHRRGIWIVAAAFIAVTIAAVAAVVGSTPFGRADQQAIGPTASLEVASLPPVAPPPPSPSASTESSAPPKPVKIPASGSGSFDVASGSSPSVGSSSTVTAYRVEVEKDLPYEAADFADAVDAILADERGWTKDGRHSFKRTTAGALRVVLATPATTDRLCAPLTTRGEVSCRNGNVVVINAIRWTLGAVSFDDDLANYRIYVINHEIGHAFGLGHAACPGPGRKAPVMLQQTIGLDGCTANPWP